MLQKVSQNLGNTLARELAMAEEQAEVIAYGLEIILGSLIKFSVILLIAYIFGILGTTLTGFLTFILLRILSGGVHFKGYFSCLIIGTIILLLIGKISSMAHILLSLNLLKFTILFTGSVVFLICLQLAPAENYNKKLTEGEKKKFKLFSGIFVLCWMCFAYLSVVLSGGEYNNFILASALALFIQGFTLMPQAYKIVGLLEMLIFKRKGGEQYVEKSVT
ncbi:MAG: hypothetical protein VR72_19005 [Clostridiaceae bacterium BRH_c20a]|nr:MAG: hypothetical protein VR72_19005 [Clostridiaceae bacterium BRH_c20a]